MGNNADTDDDGDGIPDDQDFDTDGDGFEDVIDNCPEVRNEDQLDTDNDDIGNACDSDDDGDGVADSEDAFPLDSAESVDTDGDGIGNNADEDDDGDGIDDDDPRPLDPTQTASATGLVIDGYVQGATVFLDTNFNLIREANEASAITDANGQFEILLSAEQKRAWLMRRLLPTFRWGLSTPHWVRLPSLSI